MSVDLDNNYPGEKFNREEVLSKCPFLKSYLEKNIFGFEKFIEEANKIDQEITNILGEKWEQNTLLPLVLLTQTIGLFDRNKSLPELVGGIKLFVFAGYELNSRPKSNFFLVEIATAISQEVPFNRDSLKSTEGVSAIYNLMTGLMKVGEFLHDVKGIDEGSGKSPFDKFIQGLDL